MTEQNVLETTPELKDHALRPLKGAGDRVGSKTSITDRVDSLDISQDTKSAESTTIPDSSGTTTKEPSSGTTNTLTENEKIGGTPNLRITSTSVDENKTDGDVMERGSYSMLSPTYEIKKNNSFAGGHTSPVRTSFFHKHFRKEVDNVSAFVCEPLPKDMGYANFTISNFQHTRSLEATNVWELRLVDKRIRYVGDAADGNFMPGETPPKQSRRSSFADYSQNRLLLVARSRLEGGYTNFHVSLAQSTMRHPPADISGPRVLGTVHADDFKSTAFTGFSAGLPSNKAKDLNQVRRELLHISYEHLPGTPFRRTRACIPAVVENDESAEQVVIKDDGGKKKFLEQNVGNFEEPSVYNMNSPQPIVDSGTRRASLDFGGKLVDDYDYNLQLSHVSSGFNLDEQPVITLMKKNSNAEVHNFEMTARYPLSVLQAFQIAISTFENASLDQVAG